MGISSKNPLIGFLLKPKKPINFDAEHPNRTYLKHTKDTLAGDLVKDGDTIHVDDFIPVEAIVESVYRKPNGKTYVIGKKKDGSVETWMSTIVQKGSLPAAGHRPYTYCKPYPLNTYSQKSRTLKALPSLYGLL